MKKSKNITVRVTPELYRQPGRNSKMGLLPDGRRLANYLMPDRSPRSPTLVIPTERSDEGSAVAFGISKWRYFRIADDTPRTRQDERGWGLSTIL